MKHIIGGMDATKEFIFKAFMCLRCTFKAFFRPKIRQKLATLPPRPLKYVKNGLALKVLTPSQNQT
jgi:hypothetical protein